MCINVGDIVEFSGEYFLSKDQFEIDINFRRGLVVEIQSDYLALGHKHSKVAIILCEGNLVIAPLTSDATIIRVHDS